MRQNKGSTHPLSLSRLKQSNNYLLFIPYKIPLENPSYREKPRRSSLSFSTFFHNFAQMIIQLQKPNQIGRTRLSSKCVFLLMIPPCLSVTPTIRCQTIILYTFHMPGFLLVSGCLFNVQIMVGGRNAPLDIHSLRHCGIELR